MINHNTIELLAPAKDLKCAIAAIDCGADAVYIGASRFGAREAAGNSLNDISELVRYAHRYWARVYATVNTLLHDDEIPSALQLISRLYEAGVDGLIIQDTGLLECDLPPIPFIASTQMHNNSPGRVEFLEKAGFQRVIIARELSLDEIREIRQKTSIEMEFFIHGSLCVCYSGQCYLSYALGGRSGNRGQCAQPCRKLYSLIDSRDKVLVKDKHLLSLKDLNLSDHIRELIEAGICSFKIEGRLKDKTYVSNVVAYYRAKIDEVLAELGLGKSSSGTSHVGFTPNLDKTFNRNYTTYFLHGRGERIGSIDTPKMIGEPIGRVTVSGKVSAMLDGENPLHPADGICYFDKSGELRGTVINEIRSRSFVPDKMGKIEKGVFIYRNHDHEFLTQVEKARNERLIGVKLTLKESNDGFTLTAVDENGNHASFSMSCEKSPAKKPEIALENIRKQLMKSGGTQFECSAVDIDLSKMYFFPISTLNALRRGVLEKLESVRADNRSITKCELVKNDVPYPWKTLTFEGNVLNSKAESFYRRHGVTDIEPAAESGIDLHGRRVMTTRYCIRHQLGMCPRENNSIHSPEPFFLIDSEGHKLELKFDCGRCGMEVYQ